MTQWYYAAITNVSVHEVWPGHYLQFLYAKHVSVGRAQGVRRGHQQRGVGALLRADDDRRGLPRRRPAVPARADPGRPAPRRRFIVGIRMHTQGMTMAQAEEMFVKEGYQPAPVGAVREQARHVGRDLRLLHDGQADDPEAARRLQGEDGRAATRCRASTTRSSSSVRCRCRSCGRPCSARSGQLF